MPSSASERAAPEANWVASFPGANTKPTLLQTSLCWLAEHPATTAGCALLAAAILLWLLRRPIIALTKRAYRHLKLTLSQISY